MSVTLDLVKGAIEYDSKEYSLQVSEENELRTYTVSAQDSAQVLTISLKAEEGLNALKIVDLDIGDGFYPLAGRIATEDSHQRSLEGRVTLTLERGDQALIRALVQDGAMEIAPATDAGLSKSITTAITGNADLPDFDELTLVWTVDSFAKERLTPVISKELWEKIETASQAIRKKEEEEELEEIKLDVGDGKVDSSAEKINPGTEEGRELDNDEGEDPIPDEEEHGGNGGEGGQGWVTRTIAYIIHGTCVVDLYHGVTGVFGKKEGRDEAAG